jgi:hypothetical protein
MRNRTLHFTTLGAIEYKAGTSVCEALDELSTFSLLFGKLRGADCVCDKFLRRGRPKTSRLRYTKNMDAYDPHRASTLQWLPILYGVT